MLALVGLQHVEQGGALGVEGDERLDAALRALQETGGTILSVETERATLLEVLESYESGLEDVDVEKES